MHTNQGQEKGLRNELLVEEALERIAEAKAIHSFIHASPNSREDRHGKDFIIETDAGKIFLQVKSSERGRRKFERRGISVIVVSEDETMGGLTGRLLRVIGEACRDIGRRIERIKGRRTIRRKAHFGRGMRPAYAFNR